MLQTWRVKNRSEGQRKEESTRCYCGTTAGTTTAINVHCNQTFSSLLHRNQLNERTFATCRNPHRIHIEPQNIARTGVWRLWLDLAAGQERSFSFALQQLELISKLWNASVESDWVHTNRPAFLLSVCTLKEVNNVIICSLCFTVRTNIDQIHFHLLLVFPPELPVWLLTQPCIIYTSLEAYCMCGRCCSHKRDLWPSVTTLFSCWAGILVT